MTDTTQADFVIVGAGVAGGLIAHQLATAGKSVILMDAGPIVPRWKTVERFRNQFDKSDMSACYPSYPWAPAPSYGRPHDYFIQKGPIVFASEYLRLVGGTTWHWTGNTWRFLPNDFIEKSTFGVGRDWAITYDDLEPFYYAAELALGVAGDQDYGSPRKQPYPTPMIEMPYAEQKAMDLLNAYDPTFNVTSQPSTRSRQPYDGRPMCSGNNNCSPICPIGAMYCGVTHVERAQSAGATLIPNAVAFKLELGEKKRIKAVYYKDPQGVEHRVEGRHFVLTANAIETAKLMLMSESREFPNGIGNSSGMVGRNLMDHPKTGVTFYAGMPLWPGRGPEQSSSMLGFRDGPFRATQSPKKIQNWDINVSLSEAAKIFAGGKLLKPAELDERIRDRASRFMAYTAYHEILPLPTNRITPSSSLKDAIGIPRPEIYWDVDDYVRRGMAHTHEVFDSIVKALGGTEVKHDDSVQTSHHIVGTCIQGKNPADSVVDGYGRTYDHDNLFIAGGATMASVTTVNVTLSIAALALRTADALKREG
ncbi:MAG: GMC family oxidoreductase [Rhodopila sp.]|nr:GMC family oxidoreductase [Rhodopila sp.]